MIDKHKQFTNKSIIKQLFEPAVSLMKHLSFTKKTIIIAIAILATFSVLATNLYQRLVVQIETAEQELIGLELLPPLFKTVQYLQQHRGASSGILGGTQSLLQQQSELQGEISNLLALLSDKLPPSEKAAHQNVIFQWEKILTHGMQWSIDQNFNQHIVLIKSVQMMTHDIADHYKLTNHPRLDIYYLVNTALHQLSPAQEYLGQTRAFGTGILAKKESTEHQIIGIHTLAAQSKDAIESLNIDLAKMGVHNPNIQDRLMTASVEISKNSKEIFNLVSTDIIGKSYGISAENYFNKMTESIDSSYFILYEILLPTIELLITQELINAHNTLYLTVGISVIMLAFLLYLAVGIYLVTISNINVISQSTLAFSKGDFSKRITLDSESELKHLGSSFNSMADKLTKLMHDEKEDKARIQAIIESAQDALVQMNSSGTITGWSHQAERVFSWSSGEAIGKPLHKLIIPLRFHDKHLEGIKQFIATGNGPIINTMVEVVALHRNGHEFPIELTIAPIKIDEGYEFNGFIRDITERRKAEENSQLASRVFNVSHEGITITDHHGTIIDVNPAFCKITGYSRDEIIGQNPSFLSSGKQPAEFYTEMWRTLNEYGTWQGEVWNRKKNGTLYAEFLSISTLTDENGNTLHYVGMFSDITQSKQQQDELNQMAHYDVLTGLPNRALFADRFHQAIAHSNRTKKQLAICFLDLDSFKPINDNYGHEIGDKLLIEVAERITSCIREEDTVSRQGGDEFALLLNDIESATQCEQTLERIHHSLAQPYLIDEHSHKITASSGATLYPDDDGDIDTLLRHADQAMYQSKLAGKHRYHLFNPEQDELTIQKHHQLDEIENALINNEFQLYYQPKVNMSSGEAFGAEALIRWFHPEKGLIPPLDFLPIIDGTKLELMVGNWVINEAIAQLDIWHQQGIRPEVSVNISSHHLLSETFFSDLDTALVKYPAVDSQCLQLEILESSALGDLNAITTVIEACQDLLGVKVALDDFGTGYSSLTHLRSLPVNTIKIDQSFVRDMLDDPSDSAIISGILGLADSFGRKAIAEGVETSNHGVMLLIMGCEEAQGYGIAKPMPADDYPQWLNNYIPNKEWINCANEHRTVEENEFKLFRLLTEHWKNRFIKNVQSSPEGIENWPTINANHCHCNAWINRAKQDHLFKPENFENINQTHEVFHLVAQTIQQHYQDNDIETAREGLTKLQTAFDSMNNTLGMCE